MQMYPEGQLLVCSPAGMQRKLFGHFAAATVGPLAWTAPTAANTMIAQPNNADAYFRKRLLMQKQTLPAKRDYIFEFEIDYPRCKKGAHWISG
ncbi:MAG: hypothetical protein KGI59_00885 [Patescibacteria group bacterium]|nr:hypothetical protein [Patescibacteria group bacterium]